jgi:hypothetical protein
MKQLGKIGLTIMAAILFVSFATDAVAAGICRFGGVRIGGGYTGPAGPIGGGYKNYDYSRHDSLSGLSGSNYSYPSDSISNYETGTSDDGNKKDPVKKSKKKKRSKKTEENKAVQYSVPVQVAAAPAGGSSGPGWCFISTAVR